MSIDLGEAFNAMKDAYGLTEKELLQEFRSLTRQMWGNSEFKKRYVKLHSIIIVNDNPRSMKRYPKVTKYECRICKKYFGSAEVEIDHSFGENSLKSIYDIEPFFKAIMLPKPEDLQILCKDKWSYKTQTVNGKKKKVRDKMLHQGCHGIKTVQERNGISFEQAKKQKEFILISKSDEKTLDVIMYFGVLEGDIPKTKVGRKELLRKLMFSEDING